MKGEQKYHAVPTTIDGIRFASKKEATRYLSLKLLERAGEIRDLVLQPRYPLYAPYGDFCTEPVGEYVADFAYVDARTEAKVVEDVKGMRTPLYRWKRRHMLAQYGIAIQEV